MITLYRTINDSWADEIQDYLENICIKHSVIIQEEKSDTPFLTDDDKTYKSRSEIEALLNTLSEALATWYRFDGDNCLCRADKDAVLSPALKKMFHID